MKDLVARIGTAKSIREDDLVRKEAAIKVKEVIASVDIDKKIEEINAVIEENDFMSAFA
jgi:hypothetical protein